MNFFPRQPSLFTRLQRSLFIRSLSQSGIPAEGPSFPARVFQNQPTQHRGLLPWPTTVQVLAWLTGFTLAISWLGWFFHKAF